MSLRSWKINTQRERLWPKAANVLAHRLNEIKSNLEEVGILVNDNKDLIKRTIILEICKISLEPFEHIENKNLRSTDPQLSKDTLNDEFAVSFETIPKNHTENQESDGMKDVKDILQPSHEDPNIAETPSAKTYICRWCRIT